MVGSPENMSVCMDLIPEIQLELLQLLGEDNLKRCYETLEAVKDEQIVKALLIETLGQKMYDQVKEQLFFLRMLEVNSQARD